MRKTASIALTTVFILFGFVKNAQSSDVCDYPQSNQKMPELVIYYEDDNLKTYPIAKVDDALNFYFSKKEKKQPLLLYVHGRALKDTKIGDYDREPEESKTDNYPSLSKNTKTVLMLHWPHRKVENGFPEADARFAGNALACVIRRLNSETFNTSKHPEPRFLFTHSMGALVLEEALRTQSEVDLHEFDAVAIFAAASRASDASLWLPKLNAKNRYVFINTHDVVLKGASQAINSTVLGICDLECFNDNPPAHSITYFDITQIAGALANARHNYFVKGKVADKIVPLIFKGESLPKGSDMKGLSNGVRKISDNDI